MKRFKNVLKCQSGRKVYEHNDYYGYINQIQEKAIANPEWFWSESPDATEARQWLYNNGAGAIVDDIYKNTPEELKMKIPSKMLSKDVREKRVVNKQIEGTNKVADTTFKVGLGVAGAPALISGAAAAPFATVFGLGYGALGSFVGSEIGSRFGNNIYTRGTSSDGVGASISTNRNAGSEIGGLTGGFIGGAAGGAGATELFEKPLLKQYGYSDGISFKHMLYNLMSTLDRSPLRYVPEANKFQGWYRPAEIYTSSQRAAGMNQWSNWLDNITRARETWNTKGMGSTSGTRAFFATEDPFRPGVIRWQGQDPTLGGVIEAGRNSSRFNTGLSAAKHSWDFYTKYGNFRNTDPEIHLYPDKYGYDSSHTTAVPGKVHIGLLDFESLNSQPLLEEQFTHNIYQVMGHEFAHENPVLNTRLPASPKPGTSQYTESPHYGNDYSRVPQGVKDLLKPAEFVTNPHNMENSEGFSDLFGIKNDMAAKGINPGNRKYTFLDLLRYRFSKAGRHARFFAERPGWRRQLDALNNISGTETVNP